MKSIIRHTVFNAISLYILTLMLPGVNISGGFATIFLSGLIITLLFKLLKPILNIFSLPLNLVTLGLFSFFINTILLYILTVLMPSITISGFTFEGFTFAGFVVPAMSFGTFQAYIISAAVLSIVINFFDWITKR